MKTHTYFLLALLGLTLISCATGKNAFEKGKYETAIDRAINRLQANPDNRKSQAVLVDGYKLASKYHNTRIRNAKNSQDAFKWEEVYAQYRQLNVYYNRILRCPACLDLVNPVNYQADEENAAQQAAQNRLEAARLALADSTIEAGQVAFRHLNTALDYNGNLMEAQNLLPLAQDMGTFRVLVEPIPIHSRNLTLTNEYFENRMIEYLDGFSNNRFVRFFTFQELQNTDIRPDHIVTMQFDDFVLGQTLIESKTKEVERDSVIVGTYKNDEGKEFDVYGTVKAEVTSYRKTLASTGLLNFEIRDAATGRILTNQKIPSEDVWTHEWLTFNGDERALTKDEIRMSKLRELPPPNPQTLFISFIDRIYGQVTGRVASFYRNTRI